MGQIHPTIYICTAHNGRMAFNILNDFILSGYVGAYIIISLILPIGTQSLKYYLFGFL